MTFEEMKRNAKTLLIVDVCMRIVIFIDIYLLVIEADSELLLSVSIILIVAAIADLICLKKLKNAVNTYVKTEGISNKEWKKKMYWVWKETPYKILRSSNDESEFKNRISQFYSKVN